MNTTKYGFSHADRTIIKKDWAELLPDMLPRPKTTLIKFSRMIGPLVICVNLDLDGGRKYEVEYYVHNFTLEKHVLAIYIRSHPHTSLMFIERDDHKQKYQNSCVSLKENAWIPLDGPITLYDIFSGYSNAAKSRVSHANQEYDKYITGWSKNWGIEKAKRQLKLGRLTRYEAVTPALVAAWAGEPEKAKEWLEWDIKFVSNFCIGFLEPQILVSYFDPLI